MSHQQAPVPELSAIQLALKKAQTQQAKAWSMLKGKDTWEIFTDGSAPIKNPGGAIGFSAVFVLDDDEAWDVFGGTPGRTSDPATSNNRAEIAGALTILETIYQLHQQEHTLPKNVEIVCDSQYVVNCAQGKWKKHKNKDLWKRFDQLLCVTRQQKIKLKFRWTRAHVGTKWNERADVLAKDGAFLAIGKSVSSDFPSADDSTEPEPENRSSDCSYDLSLYTEMAGKSAAKGCYKLATPKRERTTSEDIHDVITLDEAEYHLLNRALQDLLKTLEKASQQPGNFKVQVNSTRDLMLKQIQGHYGVKSERLQPLHRKTITLVKQFAGIEWTKYKKAELKSLKTW